MLKLKFSLWECQIARLLFAAGRGYQSPAAVLACSRLRRGGTPLVWQSAHLTKCTLCRLDGERNVVSIFSTSRPQLESRGWHSAQDARVFCPCFWWHATQLK